MKRGLLLLACCALATPLYAQYGCGVARDLVVQAIEKLKTSPQTQDVDDGVQLIKQAELDCATSGDVWYYRSLFEDELARRYSSAGKSQAAQAHKLLASSALNRAGILGSQAMDSHLTPFQLAAPPEAAPLLTPVQQKWALLVGIGKFKSKVDSLQYTAKDAKDMAAVLENPQIGKFKQDHVRVLTDGEATLANMKAGLNWIARQAGPSDLVLVFIATHGTSRTKDTVGHLNYILASDTLNTDEDTLFGTALPMTDISEIVRSRIQARRTVLLIDTCHSEGAGAKLLRAAAPSKDMMDSMKAGVGRALIAASGEKQSSYESDELENGVFTHYFIEGLKRQNGQSPLSAIFAYVSDQVPKQVEEEKHAMQTPVMFRSDQGSEIVIGVPAAGSAAWKAPAVLPARVAAQRR
ncbi:MAG: caspase family protein [Acidobacteriaceae bacterium]|nr:caspase family protein [Acidobacteriaceae bacterium]